MGVQLKYCVVGAGAHAHQWKCACRSANAFSKVHAFGAGSYKETQVTVRLQRYDKKVAEAAAKLAAAKIGSIRGSISHDQSPFHGDYRGKKPVEKAEPVEFAEIVRLTPSGWRNTAAANGQQRARRDRSDIDRQLDRKADASNLSRRAVLGQVRQQGPADQENFLDLELAILPDCRLPGGLLSSRLACNESMVNRDKKLRLDEWLAANGFYDSRARARDAVLRGCVRIDGVVCTKPSKGMAGTEDVKVDDPAANYVSRAALKLVHGLEHTGFDPARKVALDIGASTGGFLPGPAGARSKAGVRGRCGARPDGGFSSGRPANCQP